ncbi:hypothetical protein [Dyella sp. Tek66A03]|jgi:hypothetical protein|uniref:hypothetical protein n=1 Tax=Dyella sp. Tek66A03 TaxID=3458298 RepID=UPI00403E41D5
MNKIIVLLPLLLVLAGCEQGRTVVVHSIVNGHDVVYSKVNVTGPLASFRCLRSESGECHYTVVANDCAPASAACAAPPLHFAVREGEMRINTSLPAGFQSCVNSTPAPDDDCRQLMADAGRASR